jgi:regulatory protein
MGEEPEAASQALRDLQAALAAIQPGTAKPSAGNGASPGVPSGTRSGTAEPDEPGAGKLDVTGQGPESEGMTMCLRLLTTAPRTRVQLEQAMRRRGVPPEAAEAVLGRLTRARLIDDPTFARMWVESRQHSRGLARRALSTELRQRGVSENDVRGAVAEVSPEQEEAAARRLVARRLASTAGRPLPSRMRRLMGLLARKGYPPGLAYRVVREALEQEKNDPAGAGPPEGAPYEDALPEGALFEEAVLDAEMALDDEAGPDTEPGLDGDGLGPRSRAVPET